MITHRDIRTWFRDTEYLTVRVQRDGCVITTHLGQEHLLATVWEFTRSADTLQLTDRTRLDCFRRWQKRRAGLSCMSPSEVHRHYAAQLCQAGLVGTVTISPAGEIVVREQCQDPEFKGYLHEHYIDAQSNVHLVK